MRYYSDVTKKVYNTEKELLLDEQKVKDTELKKLAAEKAKKAERTARAKQVEQALKEAHAANDKAMNLLKDFTKDYGYYHMSVSTIDDNKTKDVTDATVKDSVNNFINLINSFIDMSI